jgi:alcohol dehydrogenase (cytochrome c)
VALSMADGKVLWKQKAADYKQGYSMTHAPLIAGGVLITGISGGEYGARGFLDGWDLKTGEKKWHRWTTAAPGEPGADTWKGDGRQDRRRADLADRQLRPRAQPRLLGHRQRRPVERGARGGDSLYIGSVLALRRPPARSSGTTSSRPATRTTTTASTSWCWPTCPTCPMRTASHQGADAGQPQRLLLRDRPQQWQADLKATQFARKVNWASGIDMATGRPIDTPMTAQVRKTEEMKEVIEVWPSAFGGKNWMPMSYDPGRKLAFFNSIDLGMKVKYVKQERPGGPNWWLGLELGRLRRPG